MELLSHRLLASAACGVVSLCVGVGVRASPGAGTRQTYRLCVRVCCHCCHWLQDDTFFALVEYKYRSKLSGDDRVW
jgi:hypothetical protein